MALRFHGTCSCSHSFGSRRDRRAFSCSGIAYKRQSQTPLYLGRLEPCCGRCPHVSYMQLPAYRADQDRDTFQATVLGQLQTIANDPSKTKRQEAVAIVASFVRATNPKALTPTQAKPSLPTQSTQPTNQPPSVLPSDTIPSSDLPLTCPPKGTIAIGWVVMPTGPNEGLNFTYNTKPMNPLLDIERWVKLPPTQQQEARELYDELLKHLDKPKPLVTSDGTVQTQNVIASVVVNFPYTGTVVVASEVHTSSGTSVKSDSTSVPVDSLSKAGRLAVTDINSFANSAADNACAVALQKLVGRSK